MKRFYMHIMLAVFLLAGNALSAQIVYVNDDATGANNGSSWADAYTSLTVALGLAQPGAEIWVAAGTYVPGPATTSTFTLPDEVSLYGGFAGNETSIEQRNIAANPSILSGDVNGDDVVDNFTMNRTDNTLHVVTVPASVTTLALIDGFTIRSGQTATLTSAPADQRSGGGMLVQGQVIVSNCTFTQNNGLSGGSLAALGNGADGMLVENCIFEKNNSTSQSAGLFFNLTADVEVFKCTFRNNTTNRGCLMPFNCNGLVVDSCLFENNSALTTTTTNFFGGGVFMWQSSFVVKNSIFRGNRANSSAGAYNDNRDGGDFFVYENCLFENNETVNASGAGFNTFTASFEMRNCQFINNKSASNGGALIGSTSNYTLDGCLFQGNEAAGFGGAILESGNSNFIIKNCTFSENVAGTGPNGGSGGGLYIGTSTGTVDSCLFDSNVAPFAGGVASYSESAKTFSNCDFVTNAAATSGGGVSVGFISNSTFNNCNFSGNTARFGAGIFVQNDSSELHVNNSTFFANTAEVTGGGVSISAGVFGSVTATTFEFNSAERGGGIYISEDSLDLTNITIDRSVFLSNDASEQGAGVFVSDSDVKISNTLIALNTSNNATLPGAGISNNAAGGKTSRVEVVNSTIAENLSVIGAGIGQWEDSDTSEATMVLHNTILSNSENYHIEDGTPVVETKGGNLSTDATLASALTGMNDANNVGDVMFVNAFGGNFELMAGSPAINTGVTTDAPAYDIRGYARDAQPDKGAYEFGAVGTFSPVSVLQLSVVPNPAVEYTEAVLDNPFNGQVSLVLIASNGAVVFTQEVMKNTPQLRIRVNLNTLPAGLYTVAVRCGGDMYVGNVVK